MTWTSVIEPAATVISTCTGPQRVEAESPVYVVLDAEEPEADAVPPVVVPPVVVPPVVVPPVVPVLLPTGATAEESALAVFVEDVEVW
jgi:hypothetical protein